MSDADAVFVVDRLLCDRCGHSPLTETCTCHPDDPIAVFIHTRRRHAAAMTLARLTDSRRRPVKRGTR